MLLVSEIGGFVIEAEVDVLWFYLKNLAWVALASEATHWKCVFVVEELAIRFAIKRGLHI